MYGLIVVGIAFLATILFGGIQTWNLRICQQQSAKALAAYAVAIEAQNTKVSEWEQKAKQAQARAAQAGKKAAGAAQAAKQKEMSILAAARPPQGASCETRETAILALIHRFRTP